MGVIAVLILDRAELPYLFKPDIFGLGCQKLLVFQNLPTCYLFSPFLCRGGWSACSAYLTGLQEDKVMNKAYTNVVAVVVMFVSDLEQCCHVTCRSRTFLKTQGH